MQNRIISINFFQSRELLREAQTNNPETKLDEELSTPLTAGERKQIEQTAVMKKYPVYPAKKLLSALKQYNSPISNPIFPNIETAKQYVRYVYTIHPKETNGVHPVAELIKHHLIETFSQSRRHSPPRN